jgi:outer membrane protein OmpA-like peptidoglycan-associated protein
MIKQTLKLIAIAGILFFMLFGYMLKAWESLEPAIQRQLEIITGGTGKNESDKTSLSSFQAAAIFSKMSIIEPAIVTFYQENNRLPRPKDFPESERLPNGFRILENGSIEALVDGHSNASVLWRFSPQAGGNGGWDCVSSTISNIAQYETGCRYDPAFQKNAPITYEHIISSSLYFESEKSDMKSINPLHQVQSWDVIRSLVTQPSVTVIDVQLAGYTDPRGSEKSNNRLAELRVISIREAFVAIGIERALIGTRVVGVDRSRSSDCLKNILSDEERIQCFSPSRRVDMIIKTREIL